MRVQLLYDQISSLPRSVVVIHAICVRKVTCDTDLRYHLRGELLFFPVRGIEQTELLFRKLFPLFLLTSADLFDFDFLFFKEALAS
jgi:hypothetical protein